MNDTPSVEDIEKYMRVQQWVTNQRHRIELEEGRYEIQFFSDEGTFVVTAHGQDQLTDELAGQLGWTRTPVGWTNAPTFLKSYLANDQPRKGFRLDRRNDA